MIKKKIIKIEKSIPVPPVVVGNGSVYPFSEMKQGDSFTVPYKTGNSGSHILTAANRYSKSHKLKWKFTTRKMGDKIRIWRIK